MRPVNLAIASLRARWAAVCAWRLYWSQMPHNAALAARARAIAEQRRCEAEMLAALDRLFPLGYSSRWDRRAAT